jgi:hypothetical protein
MALGPSRRALALVIDALVQTGATSKNLKPCCRRLEILPRLGERLGTPLQVVIGDAFGIDILQLLSRATCHGPPAANHVYLSSPVRERWIKIV